MDTNEHKLLLKDEVYRIVGCAMEILNTPGHGLPKNLHKTALIVEFGGNGC